MGLTKAQIANSNIVSLAATLLVRLVAGPACDRFGPRFTFVGCLIIGAIPTFLAGTTFNASELYALRFFIGILGGSFVPCQVWTTGFFDKNIVGTANSITAGFGNAGGGITYFVMPRIYKSLVTDGLSPHVAWRVSFVVPGILIVSVALALLLLCPDTPTGKWSDRFDVAENISRDHEVDCAVVIVPGSVTKERNSAEGRTGQQSGITREVKKANDARSDFADHETQMGEQQIIDTARGEVIQTPTFAETIQVCVSPQTLVCGICYFSTFGTELSVNSILGTWYEKNFEFLGLQGAGNWAAMLGLMNIVCRPLGGLISDLGYHASGDKVWSKKVLLHVYGLITGAMLVAIGVTNSHHLYTLTLLNGIGLAFFMEGANGLTFSLVPHVHPYANGIVSGFTGACGNLGGIVFAIIFRYVLNYGDAAWIIGVIVMALHVAVCWIPPISKHEVVGR